MAWNYRVFHTCYHPPGDAQVIHYYSIRETYYRPDGSIYALGAAAASPGGETLTALMKDHARLQEAFTRPMLTPRAIAGYQYGRNERDPQEKGTL